MSINYQKPKLRLNLDKDGVQKYTQRYFDILASDAPDSLKILQLNFLLGESYVQCEHLKSRIRNSLHKLENPAAQEEPLDLQQSHVIQFPKI